MQNMNVAVRRDTESWISTFIAKNIRKKTDYSVKQSALNPFIKHRTCYTCISIILSAWERQLQNNFRRKQTSIIVGLPLKKWQIQKNVIQVSLTHNDVLVEDGRIKAELFNRYYSTH